MLAAPHTCFAPSQCRRSGTIVSVLILVLLQVGYSSCDRADWIFYFLQYVPHEAQEPPFFPLTMFVRSCRTYPSTRCPCALQKATPHWALWSRHPTTMSFNGVCNTLGPLPITYASLYRRAGKQAWGRARLVNGNSDQPHRPPLS